MPVLGTRKGYVMDNLIVWAFISPFFVIADKLIVIDSIGYFHPQIWPVDSLVDNLFEVIDLLITTYSSKPGEIKGNKWGF